VNRDGWLARREKSDIVVAMNPETFEKDLDSLLPGGAFYYPDHIKKPITRTDVCLYAMPVQKLRPRFRSRAELARLCG
jgi:2-oxoglutarate/2-oxoacid ferredoxin oxidoreductase subunit alpha